MTSAWRSSPGREARTSGARRDAAATVLFSSAVSQAQLLVVGEAFEDLIFVGLERLPKPGEEIKTSEFVRTVGGGVVISSVAAARLGVPCAAISGFSDDAVTLLEAEGVKVTNLRQPGERHAVTASLSTRTNRSFVTFNGINDVLEDRLVTALETMTARHVHFAFFPHDCGRWEAIVASLRARAISTSWDFGWNEVLLRDRRFPHLVNALDFVFFNEQEALLYGRRLNLDAAVALWRNHPHNVILKLGSKGSRWIAGAVDVHLPPPRVHVVDTTGAGDAFNGGFLGAVLNGLGPRACLRAGNYVGGMSTRAPGGIAALPHDTEWLANARKQPR
jgi:sugar/nucleoside kinase (ribokinase family)